MAIRLLNSGRTPIRLQCGWAFTALGITNKNPLSVMIYCFQRTEQSVKLMLQQQLEEHARRKQEQRSAQAQTSLITSSSTHSLDASEIPEGWSAVGKVVFNPKVVLGHGCEGTIVYK